MGHILEMTLYGLPPSEVWLYEDKTGKYFISNMELSIVPFNSAKEREQWLSNFPDVIRHNSKPPIEEWWKPKEKTA